MREEWRIVDIAPDYLVSNRGRIKKRSNDRFVSQHFDRNGYPRVNLNVDGRIIQKLVHRLVALAFVEGYEEGLYVNYIDGIKSNCSADNLMWVTQQQSLEHARQVGVSHKLRAWEIQEDGDTVEVRRLPLHGVRREGRSR